MTAVVLENFTRAGLPAAGTTGRLVHVTDDVRGTWLDTGTRWVALNHRRIDVQELGAPGDGTGATVTTTWLTANGIPASITYTGTSFGTITFQPGVDTQDFAALAYALYLSNTLAPTYTPPPPNTIGLEECIPVYLPAGIYVVNRAVPMYATQRLSGSQSLLLASGSGAILSVLDPQKAVIEGLSFQGGDSAIAVQYHNLDATELDVDRCIFQQQASWPIDASYPDGAPKTLRVTNCKFINTGGGVVTGANQTVVENNWFEFLHTNPALDVLAQGEFNYNRIVPGPSSPSTWLVNRGQLVAERNIASGEGNAGLFALITGAAQFTVLRDNVVFSGQSSPNIRIEVFPLGICIENNWFQGNNGYIVDDSYAGLIPDAAVGQFVASQHNVFRNNVGNLATGANSAFVNGGLGFVVEGAALARGAAVLETPAARPDAELANLFPDYSELVSGSWAVNASYMNNAAVAPDGTTTAVRASSGVGGGNLLSPSFSSTTLGAAGQYTFSLYVRNTAAANNVTVVDVTDGRLVAVKPLSVSPQWTRVALQFECVSGRTHQIRINLNANATLEFWGLQINAGLRPTQYVYRGTSTTTLAYPPAGPERPLLFAAAMPLSGSWKAGAIVLNTAPAVTGTAGSRYTVLGWRRMTTGAANVLNTDWVEMRVPTGT